MDDSIDSTIGDIRDLAALEAALDRSRAEIVFHLAAQPIVRRAHREPIETFATNVIGTASVLDAVRRAPGVRAVVIVTSDKCYEQVGLERPFREDDDLGGDEPYSASKACAELVVAAYDRTFFRPESKISVCTARSGNVLGGGDWGEDRLVSDAIRALTAGTPLAVRNPRSVRPWQHVLDCVAGYLMLAERLYSDGNAWSGAWNFGPLTDPAVTAAGLSALLIEEWGAGTWAQAESAGTPESSFLALDCSKARDVLGWRPGLSLADAIRLTVAWHKAHEAGEQMLDVTHRQLDEYRRRMAS